MPPFTNPNLETQQIVFEENDLIHPFSLEIFLKSKLPMIAPIVYEFENSDSLLNVGCLNISFLENRRGKMSIPLFIMFNS